MDNYGKHVFSEEVMRERLGSELYFAFRRICDEGSPLSGEIASQVADAMRVWAMENGATHYTHWFAPITGLSAGKHEAFLSGVQDGQPIYSFSGEKLIKGEGDASSLPSGGLRATFEARGYTAWDPTSPAFILGTTLCIPTAFYSYHGEALDQKTPLLRSMQALSAASVRLLRLLGDTDVRHVRATVGVEQEYFLIDRDFYKRRLDLLICGRTLFGAKPPKGQELGDHYYGRIRTRVMAFMEDLDRTLWSLGVPSKTRHNETAPAQYEQASIFSTVNIALDHNQLLMQVMRSVARKHDFVCLLHEKPFAGVNGSGKHNNWSLATDHGENLLEPGNKPAGNTRFLLFLSAVIRAVDLYQDLIRLSACSAGNDLRLGGGEAPPDIISVFLGDAIAEVLREISLGTTPHEIDRTQLLTGLPNLPCIDLDDSDRNRTSPFAFTGNKFEFRMVGSSQSIGFPNTVLNTAVAESLTFIADRLADKDDLPSAALKIIGDIYKEHERILFCGDNYSDDWRREAKRRGLVSLPSTRDAIPVLLCEKNVALFENMAVLTKTELTARHEILYESYVNLTLIEAATMTEMVRREILPACLSYAGKLARDQEDVARAGFSKKTFTRLLFSLTALIDSIDASCTALEEQISRVNGDGDLQTRADICHGVIRANMPLLRRDCDAAEGLLPSDLWPLPNYLDMLYKQ